MGKTLTICHGPFPISHQAGFFQRLLTSSLRRRLSPKLSDRAASLQLLEPAKQKPPLRLAAAALERDPIGDRGASLVTELAEKPRLDGRQKVVARQRRLAFERLERVQP
jgi:hypothetical protein